MRSRPLDYLLRRPWRDERLPFGAPALELPRTGHDSRPLAAAGGVNLFLAGLALITGARRRRHRQAA